MTYRYIDRDTLKVAMQIPVSTTSSGINGLLDGAAETVTRLFDEYVGFGFHPVSGQRFFETSNSYHLNLKTPVLSIDGLVTDAEGNSSYESTITTDRYFLTPHNATLETPSRPYWGIELRRTVTSTAVTSSPILPMNIDRGVRVTGTWGYYNQTRSSSATLATAVTSGATTIQINFATALHVGQSILMGTERMFVTRSPVTSTGAHTSTIDVLRGQDGASNTSHSCATAITIYEYPIIQQAALYQAEQEYRAKDVPLGVAGGQPFGEQRPAGGPGLHPFVRRQLDGFRMPQAG